MNTVYYIVDLDRKGYIEFMDGEIKANCASFLEQMNASYEKAPSLGENQDLRKFLQDTIASCIDKLASGSCLPSVLSESMALGTSTPKQFYWRRDSGFHSLEDVEAHLKAHASCRIFDDEQNEVSWEQFQAAVN